MPAPTTWIREALGSGACASYGIFAPPGPRLDAGAAGGQEAIRAAARTPIGWRIIYPNLNRSGITYWVKWLDLELGYYGTAARQWARAVQEPRRQPEHVQKMIDDFKAFLLSLAEVPGQAVLSFNQRVEELLR